jgi:hypothetical protein
VDQALRHVKKAAGKIAETQVFDEKNVEKMPKLKFLMKKCRRAHLPPTPVVFFKT